MTRTEFLDRLEDYNQARQGWFRQLIARCETSQPFAPAEQTWMLDVMEEGLVLDVRLVRLLIRPYISRRRPYRPNDEEYAAILAAADFQVMRLRDLARHVCELCPPSERFVTIPSRVQIPT